MGSIRQAEETDKCYTAKVGTTNIRFLASDTIDYLGTKYSGDELYELLTNP